MVGVGASSDSDVPGLKKKFVLWLFHFFCIIFSLRYKCIYNEGYLLPAQAFNVDENSHQFWNRKRWMGVIKLDGYFLWKQIQIVPGDLAASKLGSFEATDDILQIEIKLMHLSFAGNKFKLSLEKVNCIYPQCSRNHEIFLLQTKFLSFKMIFIRVQNPWDVLSQISVQDSLNVVTIIDWNFTQKKL